MTDPSPSQPSRVPAAEHPDFFRAGRPFEWAPPGPEFWTAILEARKAKTSLSKKHEGPPNKKAGKVYERVNKETGEVYYTYPPAFHYVSADDFVEELDRACLPAGIVVLPSNVVEESPGGQRTLAASYYVAHAATGQGIVLRSDVPIMNSGGMGDPTKKSYTDSLAMFCRGFLAIPRTDQPLEEELPPLSPLPPQPPQGHRQTQTQFAPQQQFQGPPQQRQQQGPPPPMQQQGPFQQGPPQQRQQQGPPPQQRQQQPPMQQGPPPQFQQPPMQQGPPQGGFRHQGPPQHQQHQPPPRAGGPPQGAGGPPQGAGGPPQGAGYQGGVPQGPQGSYQQGGAPNQGYAPGPQGGGPAPGGMGPGHGGGQKFQGNPPGAGLNNHPAVNMAGQLLGPDSPLPGHGPEGPGFLPQSEADLGRVPPPAEAKPIRGAQEGEPQSMDDWVSQLCGKGWPEDLAMQLAAHRPDEPINQVLKEEIIRLARDYYGDAQSVRDAFEGTGYVPNPALPEAQRPKPTGLHILRFALKMTYPAAASAS